MYIARMTPAALGPHSYRAPWKRCQFCGLTSPRVRELPWGPLVGPLVSSANALACPDPAECRAVRTGSSFGGPPNGGREPNRATCDHPGCDQPPESGLTKCRGHEGGFTISLGSDP